MIVKMSVKSGELRSNSNVEMDLEPSLYNYAVKRINELAAELKAMNDELQKESCNVSL